MIVEVMDEDKLVEGEEHEEGREGGPGWNLGTHPQVRAVLKKDKLAEAEEQRREGGSW